MAKRLTRAEAEEVLRGGELRKILEALRQLPDDVDPTLAAQVLVAPVETRGWYFARNGKRLPEPVIRALLRLLSTRRHPTSVFLSNLIPEDLEAEELAERWDEALTALLDLSTSYAWGSSQRKAKLAAVAKNPRLVAAIQTTAVASPFLSLDMLAVLTLESSDESIDALMPHFERATKEKDAGLDRLKRLRTHAPDTASMRAMLSRVDTLLGDRSSSSPALTLAREIGLGELDLFWFRASLGSFETTQKNVSAFQSNLSFDSRSVSWFSASVVMNRPTDNDDHSTTFTGDRLLRDTLGLGRCAPKELPVWLATAQRKLGFQWNFEALIPSTNLRGKKRTQFLGWLAEGN